MGIKGRGFEVRGLGEIISSAQKVGAASIWIINPERETASKV